MTPTKVCILIILIGLVSFSHIPEQALGRYSLPDRSTTVQYVDNLIYKYNLLVDEYDKPRRDFNLIKAHFSLYCEVGNSFQVIVMQTVPWDEYWLSLIFIQPTIRANQPNVTMDYNDTFKSLYSGSIIKMSEYAVQENIPLTIQNATIQLDLVLTIYTSDISSDYATTSNDAAKYLYQQDESQVPTVRQTVIQTVTSAETVIVQSSTQDAFSWFNDNPLVRTIVSIFGSIITFVLIIVIIVIVVKRRKLTRELKGLLHMDQDKPENDKS